MRDLLLLGVALGLAWLPAEGQNNRSEAKGKEEIAEHYPKDSPKGNPSFTARKAGAGAEITAQENEKGQTEPSRGYFDTLISPSNLPNVILAGVGIIGIGFALRTLGWLRKQTRAIQNQATTMDKQRTESDKASAETIAALNRQIAALEGHVKAAEKTAVAAKESAEATRRNAEALINSERAWVVITVIRTAPLLLATSSQMENNQFQCTIANKGKTVAKVVQIKGESLIANPDTEIPKVPNYPPRPYDHVSQGLSFPHGTLLVPGEMTQAVSFYIDETIDDQTLRDINSLNLRFYFYGFIRYFDFAKEERRNQFCYLYIPPSSKSEARWSAVEVTGMPDYNTHT